MKNKNITIFFAAFLLTVIPVLFTNIVYDQGEVYFLRYLLTKHAPEYVQKLSKSDLGMHDYGNERVLKAEMIKTIGKDADCLILGSSQILQIGSLRPINFVKEMRCQRPLNMGVSGGSIEDIFIAIELARQNYDLKNKKIIIGMSPWFLEWQADYRYGIHYSYLEDFFKRYGRSHSFKYELDFHWYYLKHLLNWDYFKATITENAVPNDFAIIPKYLSQDLYVSRTDNVLEEGTHFHAVLKDGSKLYNHEYYEKMSTDQNTFAKHRYKLTLEMKSDAKEIFDLLKLVSDDLEKDNIKIHLLMTPYHSNFFSPEDDYSRMVRDTETLIKDNCQKNSWNCIGSYDPKNLGCTDTEFLDDMHAKLECLTKIKSPQKTLPMGIKSDEKKAIVEL